MNSKDERYIVSGRATPYRADSEVVCLAELLIDHSNLEVILVRSASDPVRCTCEVWEHTIHELEVLSSGLRLAAEKPFPDKFEVSRPSSTIGHTLNLTLSVAVELGYSLARPHDQRAKVYCSSRDWGFRDRKLGVVIAVAVGGAFGEVVMEPLQALGLADWLDDRISGFSH